MTVLCHCNQFEIYFISYSIEEYYTIESMSYIKQLTPNIEFNNVIESEENPFEDIANAQDSPPILVPSLFDYQISLIIANHTTTTSNSNYNSTSLVSSTDSNATNITYNYWHIEMTGTFDTDCYSDNSIDEFVPGYASLTLYCYNDTIGYREELYQLSFLQS